MMCTLASSVVSSAASAVAGPGTGASTNPTANTRAIVSPNAKTTASAVTVPISSSITSTVAGPSPKPETVAVGSCAVLGIVAHAVSVCIHKRAGRPSHRRPARPVRSGSAAHCMRLPAMRHARQPAGNLPGRHPRGTPAHTANRPMRPSRRKPQRMLPDRQARHRVQPWPWPGQASSQLPGQLRPCAHGDSHAFVSSRTPLRLPGQASRIVRGLSSPSLSIRARAAFPCT